MGFYSQSLITIFCCDNYFFEMICSEQVETDHVLSSEDIPKMYHWNPTDGS